MECELVKVGGLLPQRLEGRASAALTVLLRTRSRHSHPDGATLDASHLLRLAAAYVFADPQSLTKVALQAQKI